MRLEHYNKFFKTKYNLEIFNQVEKKIESGKLICKETFEEVSIKKFIPRFVSDKENYSKNFGVQWNKYKSTQLDSKSGLNISNKRVFENTKWSNETLNGKIVLEVGSGAGRFTEILLSTGATVVSFDMSFAVDANYNNNKSNDNLFIIQASVYDLPFKNDVFDYILFYGVIQHTPNPFKSFKSVYNKLKIGGEISVDTYMKQKLPKYWFHPKYSWRPLTRKMNPNILLKIIQIYMPFWLPIDTLIKKIPLRIGHKILYKIPIPCWNYVELDLSYKDRLQWAIMDTFDALGAYYDFPQSEDDLNNMVKLVKYSKKEIFLGGTGLVLNVKK